MCRTLPVHGLSHHLAKYRDRPTSPFPQPSRADTDGSTLPVPTRPDTHKTAPNYLTTSAVPEARTAADGLICGMVESDHNLMALSKELLLISALGLVRKTHLRGVRSVRVTQFRSADRSVCLQLTEY